ncbi:sigma-70 family RNA polymerase sigma factor [Rhodococcus xishaensis]|uniref:Sigma-70 family RNA polymerase sigma factor n=1 Tax=Rhodococcus xishaensis TaxID=2487364 RepID=A0A3S3DYN2_9NOCA|nr:sigma-70 family RNA polymerase sigma factor [Rhodococcus xishaensis]
MGCSESGTPRTSRSGAPERLPRVGLKPFEKIVTEHGPVVLRVCRALLGPVDSEDAWSETFLAALRGYPDLDPGANVEAWLVTIAHRKAVDVHRVRQRTAIPTDDVPEQESRRDLPGEWNHELWDALAELPFTQRAAVVYHHLAGLPYAEIARILGNSTDAARRAAADGIARLRRTYPPRSESLAQEGAVR